jgi:signal transduction histidine kinase
MDKVVQSAIEGEDRERKRIASDLHDGIGQYLGASSMNFESVKHECFKLSPKSASRFKTGLTLLKKAMEETRNIARKLMPEALEEYGLSLAVEALIEYLEKTSRVNISFESTVRESSLHNRTSINLYRIIQEALNNAIVHGQSSKIVIKLYQRDDEVECIIKDNGIGMNLDDPEIEKGLGFQSMKFRVHLMSGSIYFDSQPNKGMTITLYIPISKNAV